MLFMYTASTRYEISDYCNILPDIPDGKKKYKQGKKKKKKKGRLWLTFSARPQSREWRSSITCTCGIPKTVIKILIPNTASTCQEDYLKTPKT